MEIKDSGERTQFETGAVRDMHSGKGRMDLLPWEALVEVSKHCEEGALKYGERNCEKGIPIHSLIDSAFRHLAKYMMGMTDEDHLCAAATNLLMAMWTEDNVSGAQDIPARKKAAVVASIAESQSPDSGPEVCDCYTRDGGGPRCLGTREVDPCNCGGNKALCYFYPERRGENGES